MRNHLTLWHRAAGILHRLGDAALRAERQRAFEHLPNYLLKDIGWPASESDCCTDRAR
jgi:hypothetical protein